MLCAGVNMFTRAGLLLCSAPNLLMQSHNSDSYKRNTNPQRAHMAPTSFNQFPYSFILLSLAHSPPPPPPPLLSLLLPHLTTTLFQKYTMMEFSFKIPQTKAKLLTALAALGVTDVSNTDSKSTLTNRFIAAKEEEEAAAAAPNTKKAGRAGQAGKAKATSKETAISSYDFLREMDDKEFRDVCSSLGIEVGK